MWFIFGFITLISFSIYYGYKRINASWKGEQGSYKGISYQYKPIVSKTKMTGLLVGVDGPDGYDFSFKKETSIDRFFKFIGLAKEHQIGDEVFDDLVYVVSDDVRLQNQLSSNSTISNVIIRLFNSDVKSNCRLKEIRCNSGRLWVKMKVPFGWNENNIPDIAYKIASQLNMINDELEQIPQSSTRRWKDHFVIKSAIILAISSGLAINGFMHLMRLSWSNFPFTIDSNQLFMDSVYLGVGLIVGLIIFTLLFLGRSARTHLVLIELFFIGTFGSISTVFAEMRDINIDMDISAGVKYEAKALDKRKHRGRKSGYKYYIYINDWIDNGKRRKIKVPGGLYHRVSVGDSLVITQRVGYLNYRWVESLERKIYP